MRGTTWHQTIKNMALGALPANTSCRPSIPPSHFRALPTSAHFPAASLSLHVRILLLGLAWPSSRPRRLPGLSGGRVGLHVFISHTAHVQSLNTVPSVCSVRLRVSDDELTADGRVRVRMLGHHRGLTFIGEINGHLRPITKPQSLFQTRWVRHEAPQLVSAAFT